MSRELINKKFVSSNTKWLELNLSSPVFDKIINTATNDIRSGLVEARQCINLIECFRHHDKIWIKYKRTLGRKNLICECEAITKDNHKLTVTISPEHIIESTVMAETPKKQKLYKLSSKEQNSFWIKPDDGFNDPVQYPRVEEELTELGYHLYKQTFKSKVHL